MGAAVKIVIGLIIIAAGFGLFIDSPSLGVWNSLTGINWWNNFIITLTGVIPAILILAGIFVVWLEADELKFSKEFEEPEPEEEEEKPEEKKKPKKKK